MSRTLPPLGQELVGEIEDHWNRTQPDWARKRLLVVRLIGQHEHSVAHIMKIAGVCRQTVFTYHDKVASEGVEALLKRRWAGAAMGACRAPLWPAVGDPAGMGAPRRARARA